MQDKRTKYMILAILIIVLIPINYYIFHDNPSEAVEEVEEEVIKDITGIDVDLNGNGK